MLCPGNIAAQPAICVVELLCSASQGAFVYVYLWKDEGSDCHMYANSNHTCQER